MRAFQLRAFQLGEMASTDNNERGTVALLDRLVGLLDESGISSRLEPEVHKRARSRCLELLDAGPGETAAALAILGFAGDLLSAVAVDLAAHPGNADQLIKRFEQVAGIARAALGSEVLRRPQLPQLSTDVAIEVHLALLQVFAEVRAVSLWTMWPTGEVKHISYTGQLDPEDAQSRRAAAGLFAGESLGRIGGDSHEGVTIDQWQRPPAALLTHGSPRGADHRLLLLEAVAPLVGTVLERDELLSRARPAEEAVVSSVERRLARLRFDLHDGPQQDLHLLAEDLRSFREQLRPIIASDPNGGRMMGRLDDFEAQFVALDGDLRRISTSLESPFFQPGSLPDALEQITDAFAVRAGITPQIRLTGDFGKLSDSQQITLLALIREALSNVRAHSKARHVTIAISSRAEGVDAQVTDDGQGFDPETTLVRAAREGHLGLVGMHERVRMLGGRTRIESRPGGPTVISVSMPSWPADA